MIRAFYSDGFAADIGAHVMPMSKFALVKERICARGLPASIHAPTAATDEQLLRVQLDRGSLTNRVHYLPRR